MNHCGKVSPAGFGGTGVMVCTAEAGHGGPCREARQRCRKCDGEGLVETYSRETGIPFFVPCECRDG